MRILEVQMIRKDFPFLKKTVYLDSASVSPCPDPAIRAMIDYYRKNPYNYGVGVSSGSARVREAVDDARSTVAKFIGATSPRELVFTKNTTEAINSVAFGLKWKHGDEVITTNVEHQSNLIPWFYLQKSRGIKVRLAKANDKGIVTPREVESLITENTKLIATTHVSNVLGTIQPVSEIGKMAKYHDVLFFVDGAQSGGRVPIDVKEIGCDFFALCGRKGLLGPQGTAALFVREERYNELSPIILGSRGANILSELDYELADPPLRYESGIINTAGVIALGVSVTYLQGIGGESILNHIRTLTRNMIEGLEEFDEIDVYGSTDPRLQAGILSWNLDSAKCHEVAVKLYDSKRIVVASGLQGTPLLTSKLRADGVVRSSVHLFNSEEDVETLVAAVGQLAKKNVQTRKLDYE